MAIPRKTRGEYRPIYEALFYGKDFRALSVHGKLALVTLKGLCGALGIKSWPGLVPALAEIMGVTVPQSQKAVKELIAARWIEHEDGVVWVVRGLEFEPQLTANNPNHKKALREAAEGLPSAPIVERFMSRYAAYFVDGIQHGKGDGMGDGMGEPIPDPTLTTTPTTTLTLTPTTTTTPVVAADAGHRQQLVTAANKGITALLGREHTRPIRWDAKSTFEAAEQFASAGIDLNFAIRALYTLAKTRMPADGKPAEHLKYFAAAVLNAWRTEEAHRLAATLPTPESAEGTVAGELTWDELFAKIDRGEVFAHG